MKKYIRDFLIDCNLFDLTVFLYDKQKILEQIQQISQSEEQIKILANIVFSLSNKKLDFNIFYTEIDEICKKYKFKNKELKHLVTNLSVENVKEFVKKKYYDDRNWYERIVECDTDVFPIISKKIFPNIEPKDVKPELLYYKEFRNVDFAITASGYFSRYDFERALSFAEYIRTIVNNTRWMMIIIS